MPPAGAAGGCPKATDGVLVADAPNMGAEEAPPKAGTVLVRPDGGAAAMPPIPPMPRLAPKPPAGAAGVGVAPNMGGLDAPPWPPNWKAGGAAPKTVAEAAGVGAGESRGLALMSMEPPPGEGTAPNSLPLPLAFRPGVAAAPPPNVNELTPPGAAAVGAGAAPNVKGGTPPPPPPPVPMLLPLPEEGREGGKAGKEGVLFKPPGAVEPVVAEPKPPALPAGWSAAAGVPERGGRVDGTLAKRLPVVATALLGLGGARVTGGKAIGSRAGVDEEEEEEAAEKRLEAGAVWAAGAPKVPKEGAVEVAAPPTVAAPPNVKEGVEGAVVVVVVLAASSLPPLAELSAAAVDEEGSPPKAKEGS